MTALLSLKILQKSLNFVIWRMPAYIFFICLRYREYAEVVESRMRRFGMKTKMMILKGEESLPKEMEAVNRIRLPYAVVITPQNEQHRSITLNILHGTPQGEYNSQV